MKLHVAYTVLFIAFSMLFSCTHTQFVFVQWEFLKLNVLEGQSALFQFWGQAMALVSQRVCSESWVCGHTLVLNVSQQNTFYL